MRDDEDSDSEKLPVVKGIETEVEIVGAGTANHLPTHTPRKRPAKKQKVKKQTF